MAFALMAMGMPCYNIYVEMIWKTLFIAFPGLRIVWIHGKTVQNLSSVWVEVGKMALGVWELMLQSQRGTASQNPSVAK
jgi:hypothetical protein